MTDPRGDVPSAYVRDKRTPTPSREELRARIPGWGADLRAAHAAAAGPHSSLRER